MHNEISVVFQNGSNYNNHFLIKELANEFEGKLDCIGEKQKKKKNFVHSNRKKVTKIDKAGIESVVTISFKIKFIDSAIFMAT